MYLQKKSHIIMNNYDKKLQNLKIPVKNLNSENYVHCLVIFDFYESSLLKNYEYGVLINIQLIL